MYLKLKNGEKTISYKLAEKILKSSYYLRVGEYYLEIADNERNSYDNSVYMTNRNGEKYFIQPMSLFIENPNENIGDFIKSHRGLKFDGKKINDFSDIPNYTGTLQIVEPVFNDEAKNQQILGLKISGFLHFEGTTELNIFKFNNNFDVIDIRGFTFDTGLTSTNSMFANCYSTTGIILKGLDVSKVTDMGHMFSNCQSLTSLDLSNFNTRNVTSMIFMFRDCHRLTSLDLSNFNTSNVTNMGAMFHSCIELGMYSKLDLSSFDTRNVTTMGSMFYRCSALTNLDLSNFDTSKVTNMYQMFYYCRALTNLDLSNFDTSNVTTMSAMFDYCSALTSLDVSNFDTSNVTTMSAMFNYCIALTNLDLSNFNTSKVTDMYNMFWYCSALTNLDLSNFDTSNVTNMRSMFYRCSALTSLDLSGNIVTRETVQKICTELGKANSLQKTVYVSDSSKHEGLSFANITFAYK